jgi:hypothetical protein
MNIDKAFEAILSRIAVDFSIDCKDYYLKTPCRIKKVSKKKNKNPPLHNHPPQRTRCPTCELCKTHGNVLDPEFDKD